MSSSYLLSLHVPSGYVDAHSPVREVAVQLLGPEQGTASQHAALQKAPGKHTFERKISTSIGSQLALAGCSVGKSKAVVSDVMSII